MKLVEVFTKLFFLLKMLHMKLLFVISRKCGPIALFFVNKLNYAIIGRSLDHFYSFMNIYWKSRHFHAYSRILLLLVIIFLVWCFAFFYLENCTYSRYLGSGRGYYQIFNLISITFNFKCFEQPLGEENYHHYIYTKLFMATCFESIK